MAKNETILRLWELGSEEITLGEVKKAYDEVVSSADYNLIITESRGMGFPTIDIVSENTQYMPIHNYLQVENGSAYLVASTVGKGQQIRAQDLEKLYYKAVGAWSNFKSSVQLSKDVAGRFRASTRAAGVAGGIGAATGMAIRGSFSLAAKGMKALLRDKDAYDKEMSFYTQALGIIDYVIGGVDTIDVINKIKESAEKDNSIAQYLLGCAYTEGRGIDCNPKEGFSWYERAAENGELRSQNIVAGEYLYSDGSTYNIEQKKKAIQYLYNLGESGESWVWSLLIDIYGCGTIDGINLDYKEAVRLATTYAQYDKLKSAAFLAPIYDTDIPPYVENLKEYKDDAKAFEAYNVILDGGDKEACEIAAMRLASMCRDGRGVEKSNERSIVYLQKADSLGNLDAKLALMEAFLSGTGVEKSGRTAEKYAKEIIKLGNPEYVPPAYYSLYKIADEKGLYKESMKMANNYLSCSCIKPEIRIELEQYLNDLNAKIGKMSDEERREFLKERKRLKDYLKDIKGLNIKDKKIIALAGFVVAAILLAIIITVTKSNNNGLIIERSGGAESKQTSALEAYNEFLSQESFSRDGKLEETWYSENCSFDIAYINDDDIPELVLVNYGDAGHADGYGQVYTYEKNEVRPVARLSEPDDWESDELSTGYYERTGWIVDFTMWQGYGGFEIKNLFDDNASSMSIGYEPDEYDEDMQPSGYHIDSETVDDETFYQKLNEVTEGKELTAFNFRENNSENRNSVLLSQNTSESDEESEEGLINKKVYDYLGKSFGDISEGEELYLKSSFSGTVFYETAEESLVGFPWIEISQYGWEWGDSDYIPEDVTCTAYYGNVTDVFNVDKDITLNDLALLLGEDIHEDEIDYEYRPEVDHFVIRYYTVDNTEYKILIAYDENIEIMRVGIVM